MKFIFFNDEITPYCFPGLVIYLFSSSTFQIKLLKNAYSKVSYFCG